MKTGKAIFLPEWKHCPTPSFSLSVSLLKRKICWWFSLIQTSREKLFLNERKESARYSSRGPLAQSARENRLSRVSWLVCSGENEQQEEEEESTRLVFSLFSFCFPHRPAVRRVVRQVPAIVSHSRFFGKSLRQSNAEWSLAIKQQIKHKAKRILTRSPRLASRDHKSYRKSINSLVYL